MDHVLLKIGSDLGIFKAIVESGSPLSLSYLAKVSGAEPVFLARIMRGLTATHAVAEEGAEVYGPTKITLAFASPKGIAGIELL